MKNIIRNIFCILGLVLLAPIILVASILIFFDDGFPIIFKQTRVGLNAKNFIIYKLRTMKNNAPSLGTHEVNSNLYLRSSNILRKLKIDELPQVLNVLKGNLNLVGFRPGLVNQKELNDARKKNDIFISVTFRIFDSLLIILSLQVFFCHLISMNSIFNLLFFLTETTPNKTPNKTPQLPPPSQVVIKGTADGLKQELGRLSQNEALIRNAITVLQNTMHELKKTENKLNVTLTTQKRRLDNLFSTVSFSFLFVEDISFA